MLAHSRFCHGKADLIEKWASLPQPDTGHLDGKWDCQVPFMSHLMRDPSGLGTSVHTVPFLRPPCPSVASESLAVFVMAFPPFAELFVGTALEEHSKGTGGQPWVSGTTIAEGYN